MGRLSRHRKVKSCDPFYKGPKEIDTSSNIPVQHCDIDHQPVPRKANALFKFKRKKNKNHDDNNLTGSRKPKVKNKFSRKAGEGKREYFERLDQEAATDISEIMLKKRHVSQKRKEYLKARKEKKHKKGCQEEAVMEFTTDHFKFGEVVNEPPKLTSKPRHADLKQTGDISKRKIDSLLLQSKLEKSKETQEKRAGKSESLNKYKKRKHMSAIEQQKSDKIRQEAIDAYRKLKKNAASVM